MVPAILMMPRFERSEAPVFQLYRDSTVMLVNHLSESAEPSNKLRIANTGHVRGRTPSGGTNDCRSLANEPSTGSRRWFQVGDERVDRFRTCPSAFEQGCSVKTVWDRNPTYFQGVRQPGGHTCPYGRSVENPSTNPVTESMRDRVESVLGSENRCGVVLCRRPCR